MAKTINTRIQYCRENSDFWDNSMTVPLEGELIVYAENENSTDTYIKVGDGSSLPSNLPWLALNSNNTALTPLKTPKQINIPTYSENVTSITPEWDVILDPNKYIISGQTSARTAGTRPILLTPQDGYCWLDGTISQKTINWEIKKAEPVLQVYDTLIEPITERINLTLDNYLYGKILLIKYTDDFARSPIISVQDPSVISVIDTEYSHLGYFAFGIRPNIITPDFEGSRETIVTITLKEGVNYNAKSITLHVTNNLNISEVLQDNSWQAISEVSRAGLANTFWEIGDTKSVRVQGKIGTLEVDQDLGVYIIGFDQEGNQGIQFGTFKSMTSDDKYLCLANTYSKVSTDGTKYFNIIHTADPSNTTDWVTCDLRYDILGSTDVRYNAATSECTIQPNSNTLMAALPEELRLVMKPMTIWYGYLGHELITTDYLPLLSEYNVFGANYYAADESPYLAHYPFFASTNSRVRYRHNDIDQPAYWWTRSLDAKTPPIGDGRYFACVGSSGMYSHGVASQSLGLAPIFTI